MENPYDVHIDPGPETDWLGIVTFFVGLLCFWLGLQANDWGGFNHYQNPVKTDTIFVDRVKTDTIKIIQRSKPKVVKVYLADTFRRKRLEKDTLVSGLELRAGKLTVETITPRGIVLDNNYKLPKPEYLQLTMDASGAVSVGVDSVAIRRDKRKARWRKVGNWCLVGAGFVVGVLVGSTK